MKTFLLFSATHRKMRDPDGFHQSLLQLKNVARLRFEPTVQPVADSGMSFKFSDLKCIRFKVFVSLFQQIESLKSPPPKPSRLQQRRKQNGVLFSPEHNTLVHTKLLHISCCIFGKIAAIVACCNCALVAPRLLPPLCGACRAPTLSAANLLKLFLLLKCIKFNYAVKSLLLRRFFSAHIGTWPLSLLPPKSFTAITKLIVHALCYCAISKRHLVQLFSFNVRQFECSSSQSLGIRTFCLCDFCATLRARLQQSRAHISKDIASVQSKDPDPAMARVSNTNAILM